MRPFLKLVGRGEIHAVDSLAEVKLTRKIWYVLALLATAPDAEMLRSELTEIAWPLSDDRSRDVLMHKWRKSVVDAFAELGAHPVVVISERIVKLDTTLIKIDYLECLRLGNIILSSQIPAATMEAALEFDDLATDQVLLAGHPEAFESQRKGFDALRIQCLERGWRAAHSCNNLGVATRFADRLRALGYTEDLTLDSAADDFAVRKDSAPRNYAQAIAAVLLVGLVATPVILGRLSQRETSPKMTGNPIVDQPPTYVGRFIQYEFKSKPEDGVLRSEAVATVKVPGRGNVTTGVVQYDNLDQRILTVCTTSNKKLVWSTQTPPQSGIQYFPEHITADKFGNIFVAAHVNIRKGQAADRKPGRYLAILKYAPDGRLVSTSISRHSEDKVMHLIRVVSDTEGGAWLFTTGQQGQKRIRLSAMHLVSSGKLDETVNLGNGITEFNAITQSSTGDNFLASTKYTFTQNSSAADWQIQRVSSKGKVLWTTVIDSPAHLDDFHCDIKLAMNGDVLVYGSLATETLDGVVRSLPTVLRLDATTGKIKKTEQTQTHFLNSQVMLSPLPTLDMYVLGIYDLAQKGSNDVYFYRSRLADDLTSLALSIGLPRKMKAKRIVGMYYRGTTGSFSALLQPLEGPGQQLALIYVNKYVGTDITTGILTTDKPVHYNQADNNIVAGRFGKNFTVFEFSGLR